MSAPIERTIGRSNTASAAIQVYARGLPFARGMPLAHFEFRQALTDEEYTKQEERKRTINGYNNLQAYINRRIEEASNDEDRQYEDNISARDRIPQTVHSVGHLMQDPLEDRLGSTENELGFRRGFMLETDRTRNAVDAIFAFISKTRTEYNQLYDDLMAAIAEANEERIKVFPEIAEAAKKADEQLNTLRDTTTNLMDAHYEEKTRRREELFDAIYDGIQKHRQQQAPAPAASL